MLFNGCIFSQIGTCYNSKTMTVNAHKNLEGDVMINEMFIGATNRLLCFTFLFLFTCAAHAQESKSVKDNLVIPDSNYVQIIKTRYGSTLIGRIIEIGENEIKFQTQMGEIKIAIAKIEEIKTAPATSIKAGKYWFPNPNSTRLYFAPTGRMLKKGEGYFSDYYLFFPGIAYGISDNFTIGGGMSLVPGIGLDDQLFYFTPKIGGKVSDKVNFAGGALIIAIPGFEDDDDSPVVGILYGVGTYGTDNSSFTAGLGFGFVDGDFADKPMIMLGVEHRLSRRTAFVSENWIMPGVDNPLISYGIRFFGEKLSIDLALLNTIGEWAFFPGFPYIDFVFNF